MTAVTRADAFANQRLQLRALFGGEGDDVLVHPLIVAWMFALWGAFYRYFMYGMTLGQLGILQQAQYQLHMGFKSSLHAFRRASYDNRVDFTVDLQGHRERSHVGQKFSLGAIPSSLSTLCQVTL